MAERGVLNGILMCDLNVISCSQFVEFENVASVGMKKNNGMVD